MGAGYGEAQSQRRLERGSKDLPRWRRIGEHRPGRGVRRGAAAAAGNATGNAAAVMIVMVARGRGASAADMGADRQDGKAGGSRSGHAESQQHGLQCHRIGHRQSHRRTCRDLHA